MIRFHAFLVATAMVLAGCGSSRAVQPSAQAAPSRPEPEPAPPLSPEMSCRQLTRDAYLLRSEHLACKQDTDCTMTAPGCTEGYACGQPVRADAVEEVDRALAELSLRFKAQCAECTRERVRCVKPNPVCREERCVHEPVRATCEQLERDAEALIAAHNACSSDADCIFARDDGGCPDPFACGSVVNARHAEIFTQAATALSRAYREHCGRCARDVAMCTVATPICSEGRCARRRGR